MGEALVVCIAVAETAGLALLARSARTVAPTGPTVSLQPLLGRNPGWAPWRPAEPPWARGSPSALQVLRL